MYSLSVNLEDGVNALEHEDIKDPEDKEERELCREEGEEPLAGVHVCLQSHMLEMLQILFHNSILHRAIWISKFSETQQVK